MKKNKLKTEEIVSKFKRKGFFSYRELYDFYRVEEPDLKIGTFKWRIYKLKEKGVIKSLKRGVYKLGGNIEFIPEINKNIKKLYKYLEKKYPYIEIIIWETSWLNDFMNHQLFNSLIIVEVDKDVLEPVFYLLREKQSQVYINTKKEDIHRYIANENAIIVKPIIKDAPKRIINETNIPRVEKILVDIFFESKLFKAYQGQELINIFERVFDEYTVNLTTLIRYARNRGIKGKVINFITDNTKIDSRFLK